MSADIKVGDLVMIVRPAPCGCVMPGHGVPWTVNFIVEARELQCSECGRIHKGLFTLHTSRVPVGDGGRWFAGTREMLLKINPPAREDEQPAPPVELPEGVPA